MGVSVVGSVMEWDTGVLNIDGSRLPTNEQMSFSRAAPYTEDGKQGRTWNPTSTPGIEREQHESGRWPANMILQHKPRCERECDDGCGVRHLDEQAGILTSGTGAVKRRSSKNQQGNQGPAYGKESRPDGTPMVAYGDTGTASRFFKQVKP